MARTYSNFLLFEDVLDNLPASSDPIMVQAVNFLKNPMFTIVDSDCGTLLGSIRDTSSELEGLIEVATGTPLSQARIRYLLGQGQYKTGVRDLHTCLSHTRGGVCQQCYQGSFLGSTAPHIGTNTSVESSLVYQTDVIIGNAYTSTFPLSQSTDEYYNIKVIWKGSVVNPSSYTLGYNSITFPFNIPLSNTEGIYIVHFYVKNTESFQGLVSKTYSGGLLGMAPLPTGKTLLRERLYEDMFSDTFIGLMSEVLLQYKMIPSTYFAYVETIHSRMEKVLLILYLYGLYSNIET